MNGFLARRVAVLVVEDEVEIRQQLNLCLGNEGYRVLEATTGEEALAKAADFHPDAVFLDMGLPDMDGLVALHRLREQSHVPILIVSECRLESQMISALDGGANDYITKPFSAGELLARLRVVLRYAQVQKTEVIHCGSLSVNFSSRAVMVAGRKVRLTPTEYSLLHLLANHAGKVLTYRKILHTIWGLGQIDKIGCLHVYMRSLRKKLEPDPSHPTLLITEPSVGIRLELSGTRVNDVSARENRSGPGQARIAVD
jgi:two-component system, OmpR family, KDP operon response regulator KdpE